MQIHWKKAVNGAFATATDWTGGVAPGASDDAMLDATGKSFTVTAAGTIVVAGIDTSANATLLVAPSGRFTASNGTDGAVSAGRIVIEDGGWLAFDGVLDNNGQAIVLAGAAATGIIIDPGAATLTGGGQVLMSDNPNSMITGGGGRAESLVNVDNTISGGGTIGGGGLSLTNQSEGVIEATGRTNLVIDLSNGQPSMTNAGLIAATNIGGLTLQNGTFSNSGTIENAGGGALLIEKASVNDHDGGVLAGGDDLVLDYGTITGGALVVGGDETLSVANYADGDLSGTNLTNLGTIAVSNSAYLVLQNTVVNSGSIKLLSSGYESSLYIGKSGATLVGGGTLVMSDNPFNVISCGFAGVATLVNVDNTIAGAGLIGPNPANRAGSVKLVNDAAGVIDGDGANALTIESGAPGSILNAGLIEATGSGGLILEKGSFANTGAILNAGSGELFLLDVRLNDSGGGRISGGVGELVLQNSTITGGSLTINANETMVVKALTVADVSGTTFANNGLVQLQNSAFLAVQGAVTNTGTIQLASILNEAALYIAPQGATLSGGGQVAMGDNPKNVVTAQFPGLASLVNVDNTIVGSGVIGRDVGDNSDYLNFANQLRGVVDASGSNQLTIDASAPGQVTNAGLFETTGAGGLTLQGGLFANTGTIQSLGSGGVTLLDAVVNDAGGGVLTGGSAAIVLSKSTVTGGGLAVANGETLSVTGAALSDLSGTAFANLGMVDIGAGSFLMLQGAVANSGTILLASGAVTGLLIASNGATLSGGGQVAMADETQSMITAGSAARATLTNVDNTIAGAGTIGAYHGGGNLALTLINESLGVVDATGYNALVLNGVGGGSIVNAGLLEATGAGGLTILGETVNGAGGVILAGTGASVTIDGGTVSGGALATDTGATIHLVDGAAVTAQGTIANAGTLMVGGAGAASSLSLTGASVAQGAGGALEVASGSRLILNGATITGGSVTGSARAKISTAGGGALFDGTVNALALGATLTVTDGTDLRIEGVIANTGKIALAAKSGATEAIVQSAGATLSGQGSVTLADSIFSEVTGVGPSATLTNLDDTIAGSGLLGGGALTLVNKAKGVIDATGAHVALTINTGPSTITNAGLIEATGAAGGIVTSVVANAGLLEAAGGNLMVNGAVTGAGSAVVSAGTLSFGSAFSQNVEFTGVAGELALAQSQAYAGQISGFSAAGGTSLDLEDIAFGGSTTANYNGTTSSGVLTVTDGVHTARLGLIGNYTGSSFTTISDERGGTIVTDSQGGAAVRAFVAAAASLGPSNAAVPGTMTASTSHQSPLALATPTVG